MRISSWFDQLLQDARSALRTLRNNSGLSAVVLMLGTFAASALALALTGIYDLMTYSVARRRQEIGVRRRSVHSVSTWSAWSSAKG